MKLRIVLACCGVALGALSIAAGLGRQPKAPDAAAWVNDTTAPEIAPLAFLAGSWSGTMEGDPVEETWSKAKGDTIIGMFRWQSEGKTTMTELLNIKAEDGAAVLRLRHFGADFAPWKGECDGVAALKAGKVEKSKVTFTNSSEIGGVLSCEYETSPAADTLKITVTFKPDRQREPLRFELKREK